MPRVYRMQFKPCNDHIKTMPKAEYENIRCEIFDIFQKNGFLGTGYYDHGLIAGMSEYDMRTKAKPSRGQVNIFRIMCGIRKDDIIWVKFVHMDKTYQYYLFKANENAVGSDWLEKKFGKEKKEWFNKYDIGSCFLGRWSEAIPEESVPDEVQRLMKTPRTLLEVKKQPEESFAVWNEYEEKSIAT